MSFPIWRPRTLPRASDLRAAGSTTRFLPREDLGRHPTVASLGQWLTATYGMEAVALRDLGLRDAEDSRIFFAARQAGAIVMSKDRDFSELVLRHGAPPQVIWITCGNTSNARLQAILSHAWSNVVSLLEEGEKLVEVGDRAG